MHPYAFKCLKLLLLCGALQLLASSDKDTVAAVCKLIAELSGKLDTVVDFVLERVRPGNATGAPAAALLP